VVNGFPGGNFAATRLPAGDLMQIIIEAPKDRKFELSHRVFLEWGKSAEYRLVPVNVGFFGLNSVLPPQGGSI
jgi:hypothetical protein